MFAPHLLTTALLSLLATTALAGASKQDRPCGFKVAPCPTGQTCSRLDTACTRGENCPGVCRSGSPSTTPPPPTKTTTATQPTRTYESCGGFRVQPRDCPAGQICVDDPFSGGCGMACDAPGICVTPTFCGGFAGVRCEGGLTCVDDPRDDCDPEDGGYDCGGICV